MKKKFVLSFPDEPGAPGVAMFLSDEDILEMRDNAERFANRFIAPSVFALGNKLMPRATTSDHEQTIPLEEAPEHIRKIFSKIDLNKADVPESLKQALRKMRPDGTVQ